MDGNLLLMKLLQHAITQGRRARAAAGEHQYNKRIVFVVALKLAGFKAVAALQVDRINTGDRLIFYQ